MCVCVLLTGLRGLWLGPKLWPLAPWLEGVRPGETVGLQWGSLGARTWLLSWLCWTGRVGQRLGTGHHGPLCTDGAVGVWDS